MRHVRLQPEDFSVAEALGALEMLGGGAVASFTGMVRGDDGLVGLTLEHHPTMTLKCIEAIACDAEARWPLLGVTIFHRHGALLPGDRIVFVGTASSHRADALQACQYIIDWLKTSAPFWKHECFTDGHERWVEARLADDEAAARWAGADMST